jgi:hypothetical protein
MVSPSPSSPDEPPPEEIRILHGLQYSCGAPFPATKLWGPANAEEGTDPAAVALRTFVQGQIDPDSRWLPDTGWIEMERTSDRANYVSAGGTLGHVEVTLERDSDGTWKPHGWGDCLARIILNDRVAAPWKLDPDQPPTPGSRELHVRAVLQIGCPIGTPHPIVIEPHVRYGTRTVDVILGTVSIDTGDVACGERVPFTVALDEPLGQRTVFDAASLPLRQRFP